MIAEIATGITAAKNGITILKGVKSVADNAKMEVALSELRDCIAQTQESLLAAQQSIHALTEEKADLKKQLVEIDEWNTEKSKYQLAEIREGLCLYAYTPSDDDTTPAHWACPNCFSQKHVSILQKIHSRTSDYLCPTNDCGFSISPKELPPVRVKTGYRGNAQYS